MHRKTQKIAKKGYFLDFFSRFRRAMNSSEGSELMFVHFSVKVFDLICPTGVPVVVFTYGVCCWFFNLVEIDQKLYSSYTRCI